MAHGTPSTPHFRSRKLRRAAALLEAAGLVDAKVVETVGAATMPNERAPALRPTNVGAKLDKARARLEAPAMRKNAAETAVRAAKNRLADIREAITAGEEVVRVLEYEIKPGERVQKVSWSNDTVRRITEMLTTVPDQTEWARPGCC